MNIILEDRNCRELLFPFTHTRHVADIRIGILTIREKWELLTGLPVFANPAFRTKESILINANIIPAKNSFSTIIQASKDEIPVLENDIIKILQHPWQIFQFNDWALRQDFIAITNNKLSEKISDTNHCIAPENIFIEPSVQMEYCTLNASLGPIYIGKNAQIMEGSFIRGPFSAGESAVLKMGSKIYGATSIGPFCVAGGEIKNSVLFGFSNKAHDGYLGDSVIGEWCNLGAGTSNSNVKNTGSDVKYIVDEKHTEIVAGNKAGLLMGDYSRCAINTSFNTGTIIGVCCNIFGEMPAKYVHHFSWGIEKYIFEKALSDIRNWKKMKGKDLDENEINMLKNLYLNQ